MKHKFLLRNSLLDDPKTAASRIEVTPTTGGAQTGPVGAAAAGSTATGNAVGGVSPPRAKLSERQQAVLRWLLDHLVTPDDPPAASTKTGADAEVPDSDTGMDTSEPATRLPNDTGDAPTPSEPSLSHTPTPAATGASAAGDPTPKRRQLQKADFLLFLTELVRSYSPVADFVAAYQSQGEGGEYQGPVLAILLDRYLTDSRMSELTGNLIGWLVRAVHSPDAQAMTVNEIKAALRRATDMMECKRKHELLQALAKLLEKIVMPLLTHVMNIYNNPGNMSGRGELAAHVSSNMLLSSVLRVLYKKQVCSFEALQFS